MKCTDKKRGRTGSLLLAGLCCMLSLSGCTKDAGLEDAFKADRPGLGVQTVSENVDIAYFAEDLCVASEDVSEISADTAESYAACFFDLDTKEVLYAKNIHDQLYPASTTKIMTALLAFQNGDLDAQTTVSKTAITFNESGVSTAKLKEGDVLTLRQLLHALLMVSANDAANVIAEHLGGSTEEFANMMNEEAARIGATNTHFVNPSGLHNDEHYTTVYDLYLILEEAMQYEEFLEILQLAEYKTEYFAADGSVVSAEWSSSNQFTKGAVTVPDGVTAVGGKTGTTSKARSCLVQLFDDAKGNRYAAIILGCKERAILYEEMQSFLSNLNN